MAPEHSLDDTKSQIIKDSSKFITSTYIGNITGIITGILTRKFLGPALMGIWSYLQVIQYYANYTELGILSATERELPYYYGKNDKLKADKLKNNAFTYTTIISAILIISIVIYAVKARQDTSTPFFYGLLTIAILASCGQYGLFYTVLLRAEKNINVLSKGKIIFALTWLLFTILLVIPLNIYGLYITVTIVILVNTIYFYRSVKYSPSFELDFSELRRLFVIGIPMVFLSVGIISIMNIDRIFIVHMLGPKYLGYYSIAIMASNYIFTIPTTFSIVMFPRFQESFALQDNIVDIQNFINTPTRILSYFIAIMIGFAYLILPPVIIIILSQYTEGLTALRILLFGTFFLSLTHMSNQFLITLNKQMQLLPLICTVVLIGCLLDYSFIIWGFGINGVAIATVIAYFFYYFFSLGYAMLHYASIKFFLKFVVENLFPLITVFAFLFGIEHFFPFKEGSFLSLFTDTLIRLLVFAFLCIPLLWHVNRNTQIINRIFQLLLERLPSHS
jgi:O-antigen/teichoic acid export membrane protein